MFYLVTEKHLIAFSLQAASPNLPTVDILVRPAGTFTLMVRQAPTTYFPSRASVAPETDCRSVP